MVGIVGLLSFLLKYPWQVLSCYPGYTFHRGDDVRRKQNMNDIFISLPERKVPGIKPLTIFLAGCGMALEFAATINYNQAIGLLSLGIFVFLFIFDEGLRKRCL